MGLAEIGSIGLSEMRFCRILEAANQSGEPGSWLAQTGPASKSLPGQHHIAAFGSPPGDHSMNQRYRKSALCALFIQPAFLAPESMRRGLCHLGVVASLSILILVASVQVVNADSPPNLNADIDWNAGYGGVAEVESAFNYGRRQEEVQLGLNRGALGNLDLPSQAVWNTFGDDAKALLILNAERTARAGIFPGVVGLPFTNIQSDVDSLAQYYANYLISQNTTGHDADGRTPFQRIDDDPSLGPCHEFLNRAENLAYFLTSNSSTPLYVERAIYMWIYDDANSAWGHREAALLQDKDLATRNPTYGFSNNVGSLADEGFVGIGVAHSPYYNPDGLTWVKMGTIVVLNMIDPVSTGACPWDAPPTVTAITPGTGRNTGPVSITNVRGSNFQRGASVKLTRTGQPDISATTVSVLSGSRITCDFDLTGATTGAWNVVVTNPDTRSAKLPNAFTVIRPSGATHTAFLPMLINHWPPAATARLVSSADTASLRAYPTGHYDVEESIQLLHHQTPAGPVANGMRQNNLPLMGRPVKASLPRIAEAQATRSSRTDAWGCTYGLGRDE
jgi:hypothetical protein